LYREELGTKQTFEEWCRATARVIATADGRKFIEGLKSQVGFGNSCFIPDDDYNTHAAARRDGARSLLRTIILGSKLPESLKTKP